MTQSLEIEAVQYLSPQEEQELDGYENEVITLSNNVLESARRVGEILSVIKEKRLYAKARKTGGKVYSDFAEYAKDKFGRGKTMSYNYVSVFNVMKAIEDSGHDPMQLGSIQNTLAVHHELKRLTRVNAALNPLYKEIINKGITLIENISPIDRETGEIIVTPESIQAAFSTIEQIAVSGHYELDGDQVPMELGKIAVDDQASREMYEAIQRRRLLAADDAKQRKTNIFQPKDLPPTPKALPNVEEVYLLCPRHGTVHAYALLNGGVKMSCLCRAIIQIENNQTKFAWFDKE